MTNLEMIKRAIGESISECAIPRGAHLLVAVSGGVDSMVLLYALCEVARVYPLAISAVHLDHMYRGDAAIADAQLVESYCRACGVKCRVYRRPVQRMARCADVGFEAMARKLRYRLFSALKLALAADYIVTAHHRDDLAESVLMHILRGSGIDGLVGIEARNGDLWRPLLTVSKETLLATAEAADIPYNHDISNDDANFFRNKIRSQLMPQIARDYSAAIVDHLAQLSSIVSAERDFLKRDTIRFYDAAFDDKAERLDVISYRAAHVARRRRLLRLLYDRLIGSVQDLSFKHIVQLDDWLMAGNANSRQQLMGLVFFMDRQYVRISSGLERCTQLTARRLQLGENALDDYGLRVVVSERPLAEYLQSAVKLHLAKRYFEQGLTIRTRRPGDYMYLKGMQGRKKPLKKILNEAAIAIEARAQLPLLAAGSEVLWGLGLRSTERQSGLTASSAPSIYIYIICCD